MRKATVFIARFPYGGSEAAVCTNWVIETVHKAKTDPRVERVLHREYNDTPITMTRNRAVLDALGAGADLLLMVDSDMKPDIRLPGARPFWDTTLPFMLDHAGPCAAAAPYCGPPPHENVYVFKWANLEGGTPDPNFRLEQFTREEAAHRAGFEEVAALPTGVFMLDLRAVERLDKPWFDYEYEDAPFNTRKASTEDVFFTRNLSLVGVPQYVNWDAWAGHLKTKVVGKPSPLTVDCVREEFRRAVHSNRPGNEKLVMVGEGKSSA